MITTLLSTILATATLAAPTADEAERGKHRGHKAEAMCQMLECTAAQKSEISRIRAELRTDLEDERAEMKRLRAAFAAEKSKPNPDPEKIAAMKAQRHDNREAMRAELEQAKAQMRAVLDAKQQKKLDEALEHRGKGKNKHHGKGKKADKRGKGKNKHHGEGKNKHHGKGKKADKRGKGPDESARARGNGRFARL